MMALLRPLRPLPFCLATALAVVSSSGREAQARPTVSARNLLAGDGEDAGEKPGGPVLIVGARNGAFSGKVALKGGPVQKATASKLKGPGGVIPAANVSIRYAVPWGADWRGGRTPSGPDILLEAPPASASGEMEVWVTVKVPREAKAGTYQGTLRVAGASVLLQVKVEPWTLPDPQDYRTLVDLVQSPDTLALEYNVPLWSDKHWEFIARSFRHIGPTGSRTLYIPLICRTNFGNEESMVRWIRKGGNSYGYDFSIMEKYLDLAEKEMGKPRMVILCAWDIYLTSRMEQVPDDSKRKSGGGYFERVAVMREARNALKGKGPAVSVLNRAAGKPEMVYLPRYEDQASKALWQPLFAGIRRRMSQRGLEKTLMLGMLSDIWPNQQEVKFLHEVSGGLPWASHAHNECRKKLYNIADAAYDANAWAFRWVLNPAKGRAYGWKEPALRVTYHRFGFFNQARPAVLRTVAEQNITGKQHGVGRIGADMWYVMKNKRGRRAAPVNERYPESLWRNLDIGSWLLAPGPEGPVGTARLEFFREGVQDCEARIFIEQALTAPALKARLGGKLASRAQKLLDERQLAVWKGLGISEDKIQRHGLVDGMRSYISLKLFGEDRRKYKSSAGHYWTTEGHKWFVNSGWQERNSRLFAVAGETARALGLQAASRPGPASRARAKPARERPKERPPTPRTAAVERSPEQVCRGWFSLAANYKRVGMKEKARQYLQKIIDTYPDTEHAEKARQMMKGL